LPIGSKKASSGNYKKSNSSHQQIV